MSYFIPAYLYTGLYTVFQLFDIRRNLKIF
jgi:hypothetical protein